jgi:hypothetical protein
MLYVPDEEKAYRDKMSSYRDVVAKATEYLPIRYLLKCIKAKLIIPCYCKERQVYATGLQELNTKPLIAVSRLRHYTVLHTVRGVVVGEYRPNSTPGERW